MYLYVFYYLCYVKEISTDMLGEQVLEERDLELTLTIPSDFPRLLLLTSDDPNPPRAMKKDDPYHGRVKI